MRGSGPSASWSSCRRALNGLFFISIPTTEFIETIWEENNKPILLHKLAMYGGEDGTVFARLVPDSAKVNGWRIIAQDPIFKDIITDPDDDEMVIAYITQYKTADLEDREVAKRETVAKNDYINPGAPADTWIIRNEIANREMGGKWQVVSEEVWPYPLPPIIHWQNWPMVGNVWGMPDISDDVIELQDKANFNLSNINKIIRFFAHPFRWSRGFGMDAGFIVPYSFSCKRGRAAGYVLIEAHQTVPCIGGIAGEALESSGGKKKTLLQKAKTSLKPSKK